MRLSRAMFPLAMVAALGAVAACSASRENNPRTAQIRAVCKSTDLLPGEAPFTACVESLNDTAPTEPAALLAHRGVRYVAPSDGGNADHKTMERACFDVGLDPHGGAYWRCVENLELTLSHLNMIGNR